MIPEFGLLWTLLQELAEFTGFRKIQPTEKMDETCKEWLEHLANLKMERFKNGQD